MPLKRIFQTHFFPSKNQKPEGMCHAIRVRVFSSVKRKNIVHKVFLILSYVQKKITSSREILQRNA